MYPPFHYNFDRMDELSQQKVPFFFMIYFLMKNIEIFTENEINNNGLLVDFQQFKSFYNKII